mgnify:FL=1|tara:strand:+ start:338 stop:532 length:195 start_codon:yes stop_codon:yes gene_type:complete
MTNWQYNIGKIMETIEELEGELDYDVKMALGQKFSRLDAQLKSLNRYVEAVATIGAMALAMEDE